MQYAPTSIVIFSKSTIMKKILFAALMAVFSVQVYAGTPIPAPEVTDIKPGVTTQKQAEEMFGEPTTINNDGNKQQWLYNNKDRRVMLVWDKTTKQLLEYNYSASASAAEADQSLFCKLNAGTTKTTDAVRLLGIPTEYRIEKNQQMVIYRNKNSYLRLNFKDELLQNIDISIKAKG